jgi:hypothetical protein
MAERLGTGLLGLVVGGLPTKEIPARAGSEHAPTWQQPTFLRHEAARPQPAPGAGGPPARWQMADMVAGRAADCRYPISAVPMY